ncbi:hypothetical protein ACTG9Q_24725 [Actinokineospora sp. 24-640]
MTDTISTQGAHTAPPGPGAFPATHTIRGETTEEGPMSTGPEAEVEVLPIDHGALTRVPVWETHRRGKNRAAILPGVDPTRPSGLYRVFWTKAGGEDHFYKVPTRPLVGTAVEFAADYTDSRGNRRPCRWYGVIRAHTEQPLTIQHCATAREAINLAAEQRLADSLTIDDLHQQVLDLLNSQRTEPGQRWYPTRRHTYATRGKRTGKIADWSFVLRTDAAARVEGLIPTTHQEPGPQPAADPTNAPPATLA